MKVYIKTLGGKKSTLEVVQKIDCSKGFYVAQDGQGNTLKYINGATIELNIITSRSGFGIIDGIECNYEIEGYLNK